MAQANYVRVGDTLTNIINSHTGEMETYDKVTNYADGTIMNDTKTDGAIYRKLVTEFGVEYFKKNFEGGINVKLFGAVGDYDVVTGLGTNNTAVFNLVAALCAILKLDMIIPEGNYLANKFGRYNNINVYGSGIVNIYFKYDPTLSVVMGQMGNNSTISNINFTSLEANLPNQRFGIEQVTNAYFQKCSFSGFRDPAALPNAWGVYMKNATNITFDNCEYSNNSQSDIAVVENNRNINIINAKNVVDGGVYLNVEPNTNIINVGINVQGGLYRKMSLLLNSASAVAIQAMTVTSAEIGLLMYDGADVRFNNCKILSLSNQQNLQVFFGQLDISLGLGDNLIKDPYIFDVDPSGVGRQWKSFSGTFRTDRVGKDYTTIGDGTSIAYNVTNVDKILVEPDTTYLMSLNTRSNYKADSAFIGRSLDVRYYDASDVLLQTSQCYVNLAPSAIVTHN